MTLGGRFVWPRYQRVAVTAVLLVATACHPWHRAITRASANVDDNEADDHSVGAELSDNGAFVVFESEASDLVAGDTNETSDIFVRDGASSDIERVSIGANGQANGPSYAARISADGRYVAFVSDATNLVPNDTNGNSHVFVYDRETDSLERVSVESDGSQGDGSTFDPAISADGSTVAFVSFHSFAPPPDSRNHVYVHDRDTGQTVRASHAPNGNEGNGHSRQPALSADGRYTAFASDADNLVANDTNGVEDVFVYDRQTGAVRRVNVATDGSQAEPGVSSAPYPGISDDGNIVTFTSLASNLVAGDTNDVIDVFVRRRGANITERVSVTSSGGQASESTFASDLSPDGRFVVMRSNASLDGNDRDIFVHDRQTGTTQGGVVRNYDGRVVSALILGRPSISADGQ